MYETNIDANPLSNMFEKLVLRELVEIVAMLPVHVERMQLTWSYLIKWLKVFPGTPSREQCEIP